MAGETVNTEAHNLPATTGKVVCNGRT